MRFNDAGIFFVKKILPICSFFVKTNQNENINLLKIINIKLTFQYLAKFFSSVSYVTRATHEFTILFFLFKFHNQWIMSTNNDCDVVNTNCNTIFPSNLKYRLSTFKSFKNLYGSCSRSTYRKIVFKHYCIWFTILCWFI